jgi:hypothetical protein
MNYIALKDLPIGSIVRYKVGEEHYRIEGYERLTMVRPQPVAKHNINFKYWNFSGKDFILIESAEALKIEDFI